LVFAASARAQWNDDAEKCAETPTPDLALARCTRAIQSGELPEPSLVVTLNNRGNAYQNKGDYARAIADYDQAIRLNSDSALLFYNRGRAYQHRGDYERAIQDYEQAIRLDPTSARAITSRGRVHHLKGNYEQAIKDYDEAIALDPDYQLAFYRSGRPGSARRASTPADSAGVGPSAPEDPRHRADHIRRPPVLISAQASSNSINHSSNRIPGATAFAEGTPSTWDPAGCREARRAARFR